MNDIPKTIEVEEKDLHALILLFGGTAKALQAQDLQAVVDFMATSTRIVMNYLPEKIAMEKSTGAYVKRLLRTESLKDVEPE